MAALHYLLIALLLSERVAALQGPNARQSVKTGATVHLHCTSKQKVDIQWFKGTIFENNFTNLSSNDNYTIDDDTGTLTITNFNHQYHNGPYTCRGQYSDDRILYSCPGTLIYTEPPHFSGDHTDITTSLGNTVILQCTYPYSDPPSFIFWKKDNNVLGYSDNIIQANSGNLYIMSVSASDRGYYQCGTINHTPFNTITLSSTYLNITDKPALPTFIITPSNTIIEVGKHLEWECASSGSKVSWERLGHASLPPLANITKTGALKFTSVGENDGGVYRCIAGNSSVNVTLTIVAPPTVVLTSSNPSPLPGTNVTFTCSSSSPTLTGEVSVAGVVGGVVYRSSSPITKSFSFTYTISDHSQEGDIIGAQCLMTNQYGCDQAVINITVAADRKLTVHVPQKTVVATKGSYVNLTCEFYNNDDISLILWLKLNTLTPYNTVINQVVGSKTFSILPLGPLEISNSDLYQCTAYTSDLSTLTGNINLTVLEPTTPTPASYNITVSPKEVSLHSGDYTILTCTLTIQGDVNVLNINWTPNDGIIENKIVIDDQTTLVQANITTGTTYTCTAIIMLKGNMIYPTKSVIVTEILAVSSTPSPSPVGKLAVHVPQKTVVAIKGSYVNLTCEFYNYNDGSSIKWTKPSTTEIYHTVTNQMIESKMVSTITLGPLGISDSDLYQCVAHTSDYTQIVAGSINLTVLNASSESIPSSFTASQEVSTTTIISESSMIIPSKSVIVTKIPAVSSTPSPSPVGKLTVHVPQKTVVAIKGSYVNLTCEFYNYNKNAGILWTKLSTFTPYNTANDQVVGSKTISTLTLGPLEISDSDLYQCKAFSRDFTESANGHINLTVLVTPPPPSSSPTPYPSSSPIYPPSSSSLTPYPSSPPTYPPSPPKYPPRDVTGVWVPSSKSIQLSWLPPLDNNTNILGYKLNWGLSEMTLSVSALDSVPPSSRGYKIDKLIPDKIYQIIVWAYTIGGDGPYTLIKVQSTEFVPIPTTMVTMETTSISVPIPSITPSTSAIIELSSCTSVTSTLATVHFKVISSHNINNYTIYYHCAATGNHGYHNITILERILNVPILLPRLQPGCTYTISAEARSKTGKVIARATPCEVIMPTNDDISKSVDVQVGWSNSNDLVLTWSLSSLLSHLSRNVSVEWRIQDISSWRQVNTQQYIVSNAISYQGHLLEVRIKIDNHIVYSKTFPITLPTSLSSSILVLTTPTPNAGRQSYHSSPWLTYGVGISSLFCVSMLALMLVLLLKHIQSTRREKDKVTDHRHKTNDNTIYEVKKSLRHPQHLSKKTYRPSNGHTNGHIY